LWSFAHVDYDEHAQPPVSVTRARILAAACPGALYLLHASSQSNTAALAGVVHTLKRRGYRFATLERLQ
jgi:peptidoglycan-N-acetylmuramic acid deacetylase